jgi:hypothetical protein
VATGEWRLPCEAGCTCRKHTAGKRGAEHPHWVGNLASYHTIHKRLRDTRGPACARHCLFCAEAGRDKQADDWAQLPGTSGKDLADYVALCSSCHGRLDAPAQWSQERRSAQAARVRQMHQEGKFPAPPAAKRGEMHHGHKLTETDVRAIRVLLDEGALSLTAIGRRFKVGRKAVSRIRDGLYWGWLQ